MKTAYLLLAACCSRASGLHLESRAVAAASVITWMTTTLQKCTPSYYGTYSAVLGKKCAVYLEGEDDTTWKMAAANCSADSKCSGFQFSWEVKNNSRPSYFSSDIYDCKSNSTYTVFVKEEWMEPKYKPVLGKYCEGADDAPEDVAMSWETAAEACSAQITCQGFQFSSQFGNNTRPQYVNFDPYGPKCGSNAGTPWIMWVKLPPT